MREITEGKAAVFISVASFAAVQTMLFIVLFQGFGVAYAADVTPESSGGAAYSNAKIAASVAFADERATQSAVLHCQAKSGSAKKPAKVSLSSVSSKKAGKLSIRIKKVKSADGYEFKVGLNRKCSRGAISKLSTKTKCTFAGLKQGKRYFAKVRAYRNAGDKRVFGKWSKAKSAKVRKSKDKHPKKDGFYSFRLNDSSSSVTAAIKGSRLIVVGKGSYYKDFDAMMGEKSKRLKSSRYVFKLSSSTVFYASSSLAPSSRKYAYDTSGDYLFKGKKFVKAMNRGAFPWVDVILHDGKATFVCCDTWY